MDNKKFEQLIDLIINENEEQARALFHDIVVEKSREIYEHLMDEDTLEENLMVEPTDSSEPPVNASGEAAGLLDEIEMEEQGMNEEDDEMDLDDMDDEDTEIMDLDSDEEDLDGMDDMDDEGSVEDRVVDIEDKVDNLERLMAEFEEIMNGGGGDEESLDGMDDEAGAFAGGDDMDNPEGDEMMEAITLKPVKGLYGSKIGGDDGQQTKSTVRFNSGQNGMASKPFALGGKSESVPTSPKGPSNYGSKGETQVKGAGSFKNVPAQAKQDLTAAPKPTTTQAAGVNTKSPLAESRRTVRKTTR